MIKKTQKQLKMVFCYKKIPNLLWEKIVLGIEAEGREFPNFLRSVEQFIQTVHCSEKSEQLLETECFFYLFLEVSHI